MVRAGSSSRSRKQIGAGAGAAVCSPTPILRHCVSQPNLTEPLDINRNEEYGQKRNCAPLPLFWGTVYPDLT